MPRNLYCCPVCGRYFSGPKGKDEEEVQKPTSKEKRSAKDLLGLCKRCQSDLRKTKDAKTAPIW